MTLARAPVRVIQSPRGWLGLAFSGVWLYFASQLLRMFPSGVASALDLTIPEALELLAITSGLGQIVLFGGLTSALWRANRAAGLSNSSIRGLALGMAGITLFSLVEISLLLDWMGVPMVLFSRVPTSLAVDAGTIGGTALVFAGLASLGIGLSRAINLFGRTQRESARSEREESRTAPGSEETA